MIKAYTDYPFPELGDEGGLGPVRHCEILTWDRDKYCTILVFYVNEDGDVMGHIANIKQHYLFKTSTPSRP